MSKVLCALLVIVSSVSFALERAPTPAETLERAKKSRLDYIHGVLDVARFAPTFGSASELYPYILILDELDEIGKTYRIETLGGSPLHDLALALTRNAVKYARLDLDNVEFLRTLFRWSDDGTRYAIAHEQHRHLMPLTDKRSLLTWYAAVKTAIDTVTELKSQQYVIQAFDELQGSSMKKLLKFDLTIDEKAGLFAQTKSVSAIQEISDYLVQEVLRSRDPEYLKALLSWSVALAENMKSMTQPLPFVLASAPGRAIVESVVKLLPMEAPPELAFARRMLAVLDASQLTELSGYILQLYRDKPIPAGNVEFLLEVSRFLMKRYSDTGLSEKLADLNPLFQRLSMMRMFGNGDLEGTYDAVVDGNRAILTIADTGSSYFIMDLNILGESTGEPYVGRNSTDFSFFHVGFNFGDDTLEAHRFLPGFIPPTTAQEYLLKFRLEKDVTGRYTLAGELTTGHGNPVKVVAARTGGFPSYRNVPLRVRHVAAVGRYRGQSDDGRAIELTFTPSGPTATGTFSIGESWAKVYLNSPQLDPLRNTAYLTSGELDSGKWTQVRGQFSDDGKTFMGIYLVGGQGVRARFTLEKVQ